MYLNKSDSKLLNDLIRSSYAIDNIYADLKKLEIDNKSESLEYSKKLKDLVIAKNLEDFHYKAISDDYRRSIRFIDYLCDKSKIQNISIYELITQQAYKNRIILRTLNSLEIIIEKNYNEFKDKLPKELMNFIVKIDKDNEILKEVTDISSNLKNSFRLDIFRSYLFFLNTYIKDKNYRNFKSHLINNKYFTSFIYKNIENEIIKNNFEPNSTLYIKSKIEADLFNISNDNYTLIKDTFTKSIIIPLIIKTLNMNDLDYNDLNKSLDSLLAQTMIRALLIITSDNEIKNIYDRYNNYIKKNNYGKISENEINECFILNKHDKKNVTILSLKPNK